MAIHEWERKGMRKWVLSRCDKLDELFTALMTEIGATLHVSSFGHRWEINTKAGVIEFTCYSDWIAGRFADPVAAKKLVDCNPYSGKWNHHAHWEIEKSPTGLITPERFIEGFTSRLVKILPTGIQTGVKPWGD